MEFRLKLKPTEKTIKDYNLYPDCTINIGTIIIDTSEYEDAKKKLITEWKNGHYWNNIEDYFDAMNNVYKQYTTHVKSILNKISNNLSIISITVKEHDTHGPNYVLLVDFITIPEIISPYTTQFTNNKGVYYISFGKNKMKRDKIPIGSILEYEFTTDNIY